MALSEFEEASVRHHMDAYIQRVRPPLDVRDELDFAYKVEGQSVIVLEIRPRFDDPEQKTEIPAAKATYVKSTDEWKVYWQRSDCKWHKYDPEPFVSCIEEFINLVEEDAYACFWG